MNFEKEVIDLIKTFKVSIQLPQDNKDNTFDVGIIKNSKKIALEIKAWRMRPPIGYINRTVQRLQNAMSKNNYEEGIIITKEKISIPDRFIPNVNIRLMTLSELKKYLNEK